MIEGVSMRMVMVVVVAAFLASESTMVNVSARYLPTRSQDDKLQRLKELLKDLLESQSYNNRQQDMGSEVGDLGPSPLGGMLGMGSAGRPSVLYKRNADYVPAEPLAQQHSAGRSPASHNNMEFGKVPQ